MGTLYSEFFQLYSKEALQGFTSSAKTYSTLPDEELSLKLDRYKIWDHREHAILDIGRDAPVARSLGNSGV